MSGGYTWTSAVRKRRRTWSSGNRGQIRACKEKLKGRLISHQIQSQWFGPLLGWVSILYHRAVLALAQDFQKLKGFDGSWRCCGPSHCPLPKADVWPCAQIPTVPTQQHSSEWEKPAHWCQILQVSLVANPEWEPYKKRIWKLTSYKAIAQFNIFTVNKLKVVLKNGKCEIKWFAKTFKGSEWKTLRDVRGPVSRASPHATLHCYIWSYPC